MPPTFRELITVPSAATIRSYLTDTLGVAELPVTSWQEWSFPTRVIDAFTKVLADAFLIAVEIGSGGYGSTAAAMKDERWLDLWAWDRFRLLREGERFATGVLVLRDAGGGPHVIPSGGLIVGTADGLNFQTTADVTVPLNGTATVAVRAVAAGAAYNLPTGTTLALVTSFSGLSATNPAQAGMQTWISTAGADRETNQSFYERCLLQWALLSVATPKGYYAAKIRAAVPTITKVYVNDENPDGPGSARCICATGAGPASGADLVAANALLRTMRSVGSSTLGAYAAAARTVPVTGTAYVQAARVAETRSAVAVELGSLQARTDIHGTIYASELIRIVKSQEGVRNFIPGGGLVDLTVGDEEVATLLHEITYVAE